MQIKMVSIPVKNQDAALKFYTEKLGFKVETDALFGEGKRWIELSAPKGDVSICLFTVPGQEDRIGTFSNIIYSCDNVQKTYEILQGRGVVFTQLPQKQPWGGTTSLFQDVDGNTFCLSSET